jgi:hypothetical protein
VDEPAAQKRVTRAVEKLRAFFVKRGVTLTATAIAGAVSANSVHAAPIGLAATVTAAAAKGAAVSASTLTLIKGALKIMAWTKMKMAIVVGAAILLASTTTTIVIKAVKNNHQASKLETRAFKVDPNTFLAGMAINPTVNASTTKIVADYFASKGINLNPPKSIYFNDQSAVLFVKATTSDLNGVEKIIVQLNTTPLQVHIKTRFIKVPESDIGPILKIGTAVGGADKNTVEVMTANQATLSLRELGLFGGAETLGEPEVTTTSGRQTRMRAGSSSVDLFPTVLADGYTVKVKVLVSAPETLTAQANIWDNQTLLLGSQNSDGKNQMLVFITATMIDPAGNRIHTDEELPFAQTSVPIQEGSSSKR